MVMDRVSWLWRRKLSDKSPGGSDISVSVSSHSGQCSDDQRNDAASDVEFFDVKYDGWLTKFKNLSCLKLHQEVFNMKDFRDGASEIAIAFAVLEQALSRPAV